MIDKILKKYSSRLQITEEEVLNVFKMILNGENSEEELLNLIGYDDIDDITFILTNPKIFAEDAKYKREVSFDHKRNRYTVTNIKIDNRNKELQCKNNPGNKNHTGHQRCDNALEHDKISVNKISRKKKQNHCDKIDSKNAGNQKNTQDTNERCDDRKNKQCDTQEKPQESCDELKDDYVNKYFDTQIYESYVEITLPTIAVKKDEDLVAVSALQEKHKKYFTYNKFNTVQSSVFKTAYLSNSNFLVSAPTGCGKTDVAFLAILKALDKPGKIVFLAPMRALATEITNKLTKRLKSTKILEYTGDTDPHYDEIISSKIFVATPEKFDAATRKMHMNFTISLLIIDEIHILQTERGAVIETIVCRMFRYVEIYQNPIRIVGLSATMPNYRDIARFIRAEKVYHFDSSYRPVPLEVSLIGVRKTREEKIEHFTDEDNIIKNIETLSISETSTININELTKSSKDKQNTGPARVSTSNKTPYNDQKSHQDHSNTDPVKVKPSDKTPCKGQTVLERNEANAGVFYEPQSVSKKSNAKKYRKNEAYKQERKIINVEDLGTKKSIRKQSMKDKMNEILIEKLKPLLEKKYQVLIFVTSRLETERVKSLLETVFLQHRFGIHHAGLPRQLRLRNEDEFYKRKVNVLITTSTLAWGVNLPAKCVIIKGTEFYNQEKGRFDDLGILDLLQIFGRAGRPQFDSFGKAILITENKKLTHYFNLLNNYTQIESQLLLHIVDILNSEIYLGTVTNARDAIEWLKSTFMFVRMLKVPIMYGFTKKEIENNDIDKVLTDYVELTIRKLTECNLIEIKETFKEADYSSGALYMNKCKQTGAEKRVTKYTNDVMQVKEPSLQGCNKEISGTYKGFNKDLSYATEFTSTNIGRIASFYYLTHETIFLWQNQINYIFNEESLLEVVFQSTEFKQIILREDEITKLKFYDIEEIEGTEEIDTAIKKMKILYYLYINGLPVYNFNLFCDQEFIIKNLERLLCAFLELCLHFEIYVLYEIVNEVHKKVFAKPLKQCEGDKRPPRIIRLSEYSFIDTSRYPVMFYNKNNEIEYIANSYFSFAHLKNINHHKNDKTQLFSINHVEMLYKFGMHSCEEAYWTFNSHKKNCKHFTLHFERKKTMYTNDALFYNIKCDNSKDAVDKSMLEKDHAQNVDACDNKIDLLDINQYETTKTLTGQDKSCFNAHITDNQNLYLHDQNTISNTTATQKVECNASNNVNDINKQHCDNSAIPNTTAAQRVECNASNYNNTNKQHCDNSAIVAQKANCEGTICESINCSNKELHNACGQSGLTLSNCNLLDFTLDLEQKHFDLFITYKYKIKFEVVDEVYYKEKQKIITKKILNKINNNDTLIVCSSFEDMIQTKSDLQTLLSIRNNAFTDVSYGGIRKFTGIFVSEYNDLLKNIKSMQNNLQIFFKGISGQSMYHYFDILKIVKDNNCIIYDTKNIVKYFSEL